MTATAGRQPQEDGADVDLADVKLSLFTGRDRVDVLRGISLHIRPGDSVALMGPSGAGKSSLLYSIAGLLRIQSGRIRVDGNDLSEMPDRELAQYRRSTLGLIYQGFHLVGALDAGANVALPMVLGGMSRSVARQRAEELLEHVGLADRISHRPHQLSGGEQQRVAIARALANRPRLLLADEPTGNLDSETAGQVLDLLISLNTSGRTLVVATHNDAVAERLGRTVALTSGRLRAEVATDA
jgi:ABC-type antimicrobial peptide transport system, ATPase component